MNRRDYLASAAAICVPVAGSESEDWLPPRTATVDHLELKRAEVDGDLLGIAGTVRYSTGSRHDWYRLPPLTLVYLPEGNVEQARYRALLKPGQNGATWELPMEWRQRPLGTRVVVHMGEGSDTLEVSSDE
jgi:hypothetical protein